MEKYHKINGIFKRDAGNKNRFIEGDYARPEFRYLENLLWIFTEKVDGTNMRAIYNGKEFEFRGKSDNAQFFPGVIDTMNSLFDARKVSNLDPFFYDGFTIYGEAFGAGIQKGGGYGQQKRFIMFDVFKNDRWMPRKMVNEIARLLEIESVPVVGTGTLKEGIELVRGEGFDSLLGDLKAEGVVATPSIPLYNQYGERVITKLKTKDFPNE